MITSSRSPASSRVRVTHSPSSSSLTGEGATPTIRELGYASRIAAAYSLTVRTYISGVIHAIVAWYGWLPICQ